MSNELIVAIMAIHPLNGKYEPATTQFHNGIGNYPLDYIEVSFLRDVKGFRAIKRGNIKLNGVMNGVIS